MATLACPAAQTLFKAKYGAGRDKRNTGVPAPTNHDTQASGGDYCNTGVPGPATLSSKPSMGPAGKIAICASLPQRKPVMPMRKIATRASLALPTHSSTPRLAGIIATRVSPHRSAHHCVCGLLTHFRQQTPDTSWNYQERGVSARGQRRREVGRTSQFAWNLAPVVIDVDPSPTPQRTVASAPTYAARSLPTARFALEIWTLNKTLGADGNIRDPLAITDGPPGNLVKVHAPIQTREGETIRDHNIVSSLGATRLHERR
ncbi:hypothetical protein BDK51DRAFT_46624 [Blyttiomyces helicus]|uniref:Uncharacterized protein n=1 Tax=Blyttiomyces helicus TaxID=388810 RepID=A0A4V1ISH5_9FUNG|nr:hypothetical protein BDK51DRAFT_46624 [Blyttiomyces helicus]|eukprot:RKO93577.1 hypothetical protein BDK51DRAFT_46624 [Blyttiomyces helicus]